MQALAIERVGEFAMSNFTGPADERIVQRKRAKAGFFFALTWLVVTVAMAVWGVSAYNWEQSQLYAYVVPPTVLGLLATFVITFRPKRRSTRAFLVVAAMFMMIFMVLAVMHWR